MKYDQILNLIYDNFKKKIEYSNIHFIKENNTNIVKIVDFNLDKKIINGTIIEQNHVVTMYLNIYEQNKNYIVFSTAYIKNINGYYQAIIYNFLIENDKIIDNEIIGRYFKNRNELYNYSKQDIIVDEKIIKDRYNEISNSYKKYIKGL